MSSITLSGVTKRFDDAVAVDDVSLTIDDHEMLVLLGPSGCGKSTILRMIAGLEQPTAGEIRIGERVVNDVEPKDRDLAMVFQSYALYPHMTVRANIEFPLRSRRMAKDERAVRVQAAVAMLDLSDLLDRKPAQLSGGQRQRVALARAVVRDPAAFLMDEPLSNLDAKLRAATRVELVDLQRRLAATVVYVTHDQTEAMTMGNRVAIMDRGAIRQVGSPQDVYDRPTNLFVARFVGSPPMNVVDGATAAAFTGRDRPGTLVGIRPEHLAVVADEGAPSATVELVERLGHEQHVICRLADGQLVTVRQGSDTEAPALHARVGLGAPVHHLHFFDGETGDRVSA
ncbi:MAG: ABC transporter ATP-binding protein [Actinomycetota bacterium]